MDILNISIISIIEMSDFLFSAGFLLGTVMFLVQAWKHIQTREQNLKSMISYLVLAILNANGVTYFFRHGDTYAMFGSLLQTEALLINFIVILWSRWTVKNSIKIPHSEEKKILHHRV